MKRIEIEIDEQGEVSVEVSGAYGQECEAMTADIEKALGTVSSRKRKSEYYRAQRQQQHIQQ